jgi:molybdopterin/thiamine biosynthesis adenylyltransferase
MIVPTDRMPEFMGLARGVNPRALLAGTRVVLIGVGSVGARAALHCGRCGVGELVLVDGKPFGPNFFTQATRGARDVGRGKASTVARWVRAVAPDTTVRAYARPIEAVPWSALEGADLAIASTDNLPAEVEAGRRFLALGRPLVMASVHGPSLTAEVRTFSNRDADRPCPACCFTEAERRQLDGQVRFSCDPSGAARARVTGPPTASVSPLCSIAADLAVIELLSIRLGLGAELGDRVRQYNFYTHATTTTPLARNRACPVEHVVLHRAAVARRPGDCTLRECAAAAGVRDDDEFLRTTIDVDGMVYAARVTCLRCGADAPHHRFLRPGAPTRRRCASCGGPGLVPHPFHTHERFLPRRAESPELCHVPLRSLGATPACVIVRGPQHAALVTHQPDDGGPPT